ncbi:class I SAM-dependent methyltransferase [Rhodococcus sp. UNC363MFTsu5.1]|uniref:class I SAM-dependent methyltransferase n=1 Tax=Rhodococcus sp. UNC363MFTsu5.1 TaxID=1449069 RepID=UPI0004831E71|nr:class I SAM-dependent methyltransferase [Rhodococcus sp. UNC363MFTsu5.1]
MTQHSHQHGHTHGHAHGHHHEHGHHDEAGLADMLDLDAEVHGARLGEVTDWVGRFAPDAPRAVADIGAGTGTGTLALARRFPEAELIAIDSSEAMLERLLASARGGGPVDRLRVVQADLDAGWPAVGAVDVAWAALSLHHVADPDRVLRDIYEALNPGGLLAVIEMDALPRFLPDDVGVGRPGLESRCHEAIARANWNAHPDWRPHLEAAGFEIAEQRTFAFDVSPAQASMARYAQTFLTRVRASLGDSLDAADLDTLDQLLAGDGPGSLQRRSDLRLRGSRTGWAARRP